MGGGQESVLPCVWDEETKTLNRLCRIIKQGGLAQLYCRRYKVKTVQKKITTKNLRLTAQALPSSGQSLLCVILDSYHGISSCTLEMMI